MIVKRIILHGQVRWQLDYRLAGKRKRPVFKTKAAAEAELLRVKTQLAECGKAFDLLRGDRRIEVMKILREIEAAGQTLRGIWDAFQVAGRKSSPGMTLERGIGLLVEAKRVAGCRESYVTNLGQFLAAFAKGREAMRIEEVTPESIEEWLAAGNRITKAARLSTLFGFAVRRGWIAGNPCKQLEHTRADRHPPQILTHRQVLKAVAYTRLHEPECLAWLAVTLFAGLRPEEADKLAWGQVDTKAGTVRVDAATSKIRQRRIVHLMLAAGAWLTEADKLGARLPIPQATRRKYQRRLRDRLGFDAWPKDVLRHTCASHWLAHAQDAGKIALELGNSVGVLLRHYRELVTAEEAKRFWAITPRKTGDKK